MRDSYSRDVIIASILNAAGVFDMLADIVVGYAKLAPEEILRIVLNSMTSPGVIVFPILWRIHDWTQVVQHYNNPFDDTLTICLSGDYVHITSARGISIRGFHMSRAWPIITAIRHDVETRHFEGESIEMASKGYFDLLFDMVIEY
jgi:hypothetical protein